MTITPSACLEVPYEILAVVAMTFTRATGNQSAEWQPRLHLVRVSVTHPF